MNAFTAIFITAIVISYLVEQWLARKQTIAVTTHRGDVPEAFKKTITLKQHQKAADYTLAKMNLGLTESLISTMILLILIFGGVLNSIAILWFQDISLSSQLLSGVAVVLSVFILSHLIELPVHWYQTFKLEEQYGFNKMTRGQFIKDQFLQIALMVIIAGPLIATILWVMQNQKEYWWLIAWAILISFSLLMSWLYPVLIAPLFNKFKPLDDPELNERIQKLMDKCGFQSKGIFVMDGSRRSGHGNAYFTGFGKNKRIVFFDTLLEKLSADEVEAVLAHELGHFKRKHILKQLIASSIMSLIGFAIMGTLYTQEWFYEGLGITVITPSIALVLFILITPAFTFFLQPLSAKFQRKFEFEADDYAAEKTSSKNLVTALVKLYRDNASTLTPDMTYSNFYHSHPPANIRIDHLTGK
jgi:STE24 endopeptidase